MTQQSEAVSGCLLSRPWHRQDVGWCPHQSRWNTAMGVDGLPWLCPGVMLGSVHLVLALCCGQAALLPSS